MHTSVCLTLYFSICKVSVAVSFSDGGGRNYKITEGKNCLWGSSPGNVNSVWSTVLLVEHERERLDWRITTGFTTEPQKIKKKLIKDVRVVCNYYMEVQTRARIAHFIPFITTDAEGETKVIYQKLRAKKIFFGGKHQWRTSRGSTVGASWRKWLEIWSVQKVTLCVVCATLDPRLSDPGDGVQAQLWGASSRTHGLRKVSLLTQGKTLIQVLKLCLHRWGRLSTVL